MNRLTGFALVLALGSLLTGCGGSGPRAAVPSQVREAIVRDYPGMAYVPGRLPSGYHYAKWIRARSQKAYVMTFGHGSGKSTVYLELQVVQRRSCPAPPKWRAKGVLHVNGHALKWLQTDNVGSVVWRCLTSRGRSVAIFGQGGPRRRLAELVGYALPAH